MTLPEARQSEIIAHMKAHQLHETKAWLREQDVRTSDAALSRFWSWWHLRQQLKRNQSTVETLLQELQRANPDFSAHQVQEVGQAFFTALALEQQDPKAWFLSQQLALKKQQLNLDREKFELLKKKAEQAEAAKQVVSSADTAEEKQAKLRAIFGMS